MFFERGKGLFFHLFYLFIIILNWCCIYELNLKEEEHQTLCGVVLSEASIITNLENSFMYIP